MGTDPISGQATTQPRQAGRRRWEWVLVFLSGVARSESRRPRRPLLIPPGVLLGSFLVPVTAVIWNYDRDVDSALSGERIFTTFVVGGVLGVLAASVLESSLLSPSPWSYFGVGFIEEFVKFAALVGA